MLRYLFVTFLIVLLVLGCETNPIQPPIPDPDVILSSTGYEIGLKDEKQFVRNTKITVNVTKQTLVRAFWWPENGDIVYSDTLHLNFDYLNGKLVFYNGGVFPVKEELTGNKYQYSFNIVDKERVLQYWVLNEDIL